MAERVKKPNCGFLILAFPALRYARRTNNKTCGQPQQKILESLALSRIFLFLESADPYLDPLCFCHTMDVLIHSVCAFTFHAVCGVSVHIKGKRRGLMSEILLHSLDVITGLQAVYGVSMTEIMILQPSNLRAG